MTADFYPSVPVFENFLIIALIKLIISSKTYRFSEDINFHDTLVFGFLWEKFYGILCVKTRKL